MVDNMPPQLIMSPDVPRQQDDSIVWRYDPEDLLDFLKHDLKGEIWVPHKKGTGGDWVGKRAQQLLNDEGVTTIISTIRTMVNKFTVLSNLTDDEIIEICRDINTALVETLYFKYKQFGADKKNLDLIEAKTMNFIFISLKKSLGGKERESLYSRLFRHETVGGPQKKEPSKWVPDVFPGGPSP